jgi:hypothetical protein
MAVIIDKNQADEILKQYRKKYPEYWEKMKQHQAFWVMLRDKNLPEPDDIPTHEMIDFTNDNLHKIRDYSKRCIDRTWVLIFHGSKASILDCL